MENQDLLILDFPELTPVESGYEPFFNGLLQIVRGQEINTALGQLIHDYVLDHVKNTYAGIENYSAKSYVRNYIGRDKSGWEAIAMTWQRGNRTAIHSHPRFASYTICEGKFLIEIFETASDGSIRLADAVVAEGPQCFYAVGEQDDNSNHIHRITCISEKGHSLHVYSGDARMGRKYDFD